MKKIYGLLSILGVTLILVACGTDDAPIIFDPVIVPGFQVNLETTISFEEIENQMREALEELPYPLTELDEYTLMYIYNTIELPEQLFTFNLVPISIELNQEFEDEILEASMPIDYLIQADTEGTFTFGDIEFTNAGVFVYQITQTIQVENVNATDQWQLDWDSAHYITVTIIEDEESETLVTTVDH